MDNTIAFGQRQNTASEFLTSSRLSMIALQSAHFIFIHQSFRLIIWRLNVSSLVQFQTFYFSPTYNIFFLSFNTHSLLYSQRDACATLLSFLFLSFPLFHQPLSLLPNLACCQQSWDVNPVTTDNICSIYLSLLIHLIRFTSLLDETGIKIHENNFESRLQRSHIWIISSSPHSLFVISLCPNNTSSPPCSKFSPKQIGSKLCGVLIPIWLSFGVSIPSSSKCFL